MRCGHEGVRFRLGHLAGFVLEIGVPAKGAGGYKISTVFDIPRNEPHYPGLRVAETMSSSFELDLPYSETRSFSLLKELSDMALFFGVHVRCNTYSDC